MEIGTVILVLGVIGFAIASPGFRNIVFVGLALCVLSIGWMVIVSKARDMDWEKQHAAEQKIYCSQTSGERWSAYPDIRCRTPERR